MTQDSDYITIDLSLLDPVKFWPRPLVVVARLGRQGQIAVSSTLHRLLGVDRLPLAMPDSIPCVTVQERDSLIGPWPPEPPLPDLYREVRRAVLHVLYPKVLATKLREQGRLDADQLKLAPEGAVPHEREVAACWSTFWQAIESHLDADALSLAAAVGGDLEIYNILAQRPASRDLVRMAPILGTLLDPEVPIGLERGRRVRDSIGAMAMQAADREPTAPVPQLPLASGFMEWLNRAPMSPDTVPRIRRSRSLRHLVLTMASAGNALSSSRIRAIHSDMQWYMVHSAGLFLGAAGMLTAVRNPEAAMRTIDRDYRLTGHPDFVRKCGHFRRCLEIGSAMSNRPEAFKGVRSIRRMIKLTREWEAVGVEERLREETERVRRDFEAAQSAPRRYPKPPFHWASTTDPESPWHLVHLDTDLAVLEDALAMQTCLAKYRMMCERGGTFLFSVRDSADERVATVQVTPAGELRELRGPQNNTVGSDLNAWVKSILGSHKPP